MSTEILGIDAAVEVVQGAAGVDETARTGLLHDDVDAGDEADRVVHRALEERAHLLDRCPDHLDAADVAFPSPSVAAIRMAGISTVSKPMTYAVTASTATVSVPAMSRFISLGRAGMRALTFHGDDAVDKRQIRLARAQKIGALLAQVQPVHVLLLAAGMDVGNDALPVFDALESRCRPGGSSSWAG